MRKHWVALLSMLGLASAGMPLQSQVLKGSKPATSKVDKARTQSSSQGAAGNSGKLPVNQQALRQQNQGSNASGGGATKANDAALTKADNGALTKDALTKAKTNSATAANGQKNALTKGALTKGALTKAKTNSATAANGQKNALTKASLTKGALTKAKGAEQK